MAHSHFLLGTRTKQKQALGALHALPWRRQPVAHRPNELFIDAVESLRWAQDEHGAVLHAAIDGELQANCLLSGNEPLLKLHFSKAS